MVMTTFNIPRYTRRGGQWIDMNYDKDFAKTLRESIEKLRTQKYEQPQIAVSPRQLEAIEEAITAAPTDEEVRKKFGDDYL